MTRRFLLAVGTAEYRHPDLANIPLVNKELEAIEAALCEGCGFEQVTLETCPRLNPEARQFQDALAAWFSAPERNAEDIVVVYVTGHGVVSPSGLYYVCTTDSNPHAIANSAVAPEQLATLCLEQCLPRRVLFVFDTCNAAHGVQATITKALQVFERNPAGQQRTVHAIAASSRLDVADLHRSFADVTFDLRAQRRHLAEPGLFARAFASELGELRHGGVHAEFLEVRVLLEAIRERWQAEGRAQQLGYATFGTGAGFFPNPRYRPDLAPGLDLATQRRLPAIAAGDLRGHFGPRARGVELDHHVGWHFAGRTNALRRVVAWLAESPAAPAVLWVTGKPGSGKSALLARLATTSDPELRQDPAFREQAGIDTAPAGTVPPEASFARCVYARQKSMLDVVRELADATGVSADTPKALIDGFAARGAGRVTLLVDALDEAIDAERLRDELLLPLARLPEHRVLIGARGSCIPPGAEAIDLDAAAWFDPSDVALYAESLLRDVKNPDRFTPYRDRGDLARIVAGAVGERAKHCFLLAGITARTLAARAAVVDIADPAWKASLPSKLDAALDAYLARFSADDSTRARDLLRPLAYALGRGLPWEGLWAPLASALAETRYDDGDVAWVREVAADYVVEDQEDGRSVYRLFHEELGRALRPKSPRAENAERQAFAQALLASVPVEADGARAWEHAHPYVLRHLSTHLASVGELDAVVADPLFLAVAQPEQLLRVLPRVCEPQAKAGAEVYGLSAHRFNVLSLNERLSLMHTVAMEQGLRWSAPSGAGVPFRVRKVLGRARTPHRVILVRSDERSHCLAQAESVPVLVSGCSNGTVRIRDIANGALLGAPVEGHKGAIYSIAVGVLNGKSVVVTGSEDCTVRAWELSSGTPVCAPLHGHTSMVASVALGTLMGRPVVVSGSHDQTVRVWDIGNSSLICASTLGHTGPVTSVALGALGDRPVIVSGSLDGNVRVWDLATCRPIGAPYSLRNDHVTSVAVASRNGRPVVVAGYLLGSVLVWDLETGTLVYSPIRGHVNTVNSVAVLPLAEGPVVVSGSTDRTVRVWDFATGSGTSSPLAEHAATVTSISALATADGPLVISGSLDGIVRVWEPERDGPAGATREGHTMVVTSVAIGTQDGRSMVISGSVDRSVRVWDLAPDVPVCLRCAKYPDDIFGVALAMLDGRQLAVSGGEQGVVCVWELASREPVCAPRMSHRRNVNTVAVGTLNGRGVVVSGSGDRTVRVWDLATGDPLGPPLKGHGHAVTSVAVGELAERAIVASGSADRTVRVWDLSTGKTICGPLNGHTEAVTSVALGKMGRLPVIVSGSFDRSVRVWDLTTGALVGSPLEGHTSSVSSVAIGILDEQQVIVSGSWDRTVRVWVPDTGATVTIPLEEPVLSLALATQGIVTAAGPRVLLFESTEGRAFRSA